MRNYFTSNCSNHYENFWSTVSPFITDKKLTGKRIFYWQTKMRRFLILNVYQNSLMIILAVWPMGLDLANGIGFDDDEESAKDAIMKHRTHPSISWIGQNRHNVKTFEFQKVNEVDVKRKLRNINIRKATGFDNIPGKIFSRSQFGAIFPNVALIYYFYLFSQFSWHNEMCGTLPPV